MLEEMKEIEEVFELLRKWMALPKYQLERRVDIFFVIYLEDILSKSLGINKEKIKKILPEFPLRKKQNRAKETYASNNADYAVFVEENEKIKLYLVELKTEMNSVTENQISYYKRVVGYDEEKKKGVGEKILTDIIEIEKKSDQWRKYDYLLECLEELNLVELVKDNGKDKRKEWKVTEDNKRIDDEIGIIYITPIESEKLRAEKNIIKSITFDKIIKILKNEKGEFVKKIIDLLENIEKYNEEEKNRRENKKNKL